MNPRWTELEDANGMCYVDLSCVEGISGPISKGDNPESRKIMLRSSYICYALNSPANCEKLGIPFASLDVAARKQKARKAGRMPWMRRPAKD